MNSRRAPRGGVEKSGRSDSSSSTSKRRVTHPLSKKELVIALGGIDLQFLLPRTQMTESPEQRSRVVLCDSTSSSSHPESCSTPPILSEQKAYGYRPQQRESLPQAMPWLQSPASTPSTQRCSNFLDNILTTTEERTFLRNMMYTTQSRQRCSDFLDNILTTAEERTFLRCEMSVTAFPSEKGTTQPETESGPQAPKYTPLFVAPSEVEYNPSCF